MILTYSFEFSLVQKLKITLLQLTEKRNFIFFLILKVLARQIMITLVLLVLIEVKVSWVFSTAERTGQLFYSWTLNRTSKKRTFISGQKLLRCRFWKLYQKCWGSGGLYFSLFFFSIIYSKSSQFEIKCSVQFSF